MNEELVRFDSVLRARTTDTELLKLFDQLDASVKFSLDIKPDCYAMLIKDCIKRLPDQALKPLLLTLSRLYLFDLMRTELDAQLVAKIGISLTKRVMQAFGPSTAGYMAAMQGLELAEISYSRAETLELCIASGLPQATVDEICDATYKAHYTEAPRDYFKDFAPSP
ncbi:MAG: hypothetical protein K2X44_03405 [Magnetospirillum sp.]|nr:hypothetical protein [Magnetospirillum sp.]